MANLVTKFGYLKPGARQGRGGYVKYIATRDGVEKLDDSQRLAPATAKQRQFIEELLRDFPDCKEMLEYEDYASRQTIGAASDFISRALEDNAHKILDSKTYADYIATRPRAERFGSHGLFTDSGVQVDLQKVSDDLNRHKGNVWTIIISLRREDAVRLGFDHGSRWRDMLRTQTQALAENLKIPMEHLKWFAAFHDESYHPHVHLIAYSSTENEGYLSKQGVMKLRSAFACDIFAQDLLCVYDQQTAYRDDLRQVSWERVEELVGQIKAGQYDSVGLEMQLVMLARRLKRHKGKKVYGYLSAGTKKLVDSIVDDLAMDSRIAELYDLWYEQRERILQTYTSHLPERVPLSRNEDFKVVRNAVVKAAVELITVEMGGQDSQEEDAPLPPADELPEFEPSSPGQSRGKKKSWWTDAYMLARQYLYGIGDTPRDLEKAAALLTVEAQKGNGFAMYDLGKIHLDKEQGGAAQEWFRKAHRAFLTKESHARKPGYLRYRIGKLYALGHGVDQDFSAAARWYGKALQEENPFAAYALGCLYLRGQGVEQNDAQAFDLFYQAANHEEKPNAYAADELGKMYERGIGIQADEPAAHEWYRQAYAGFLSIEKQFAEDKLYYRLGHMNLTGKGTPVDIPQAARYFEKAARLGNVDAQYTLGRLLLRGEGLQKDAPAGVFWLGQAAKKGHLLAPYLLGKTLLLGADVPRDADRALILLEKAIEQGHIRAAAFLGKAYMQGELLPRDVEKGLTLLESAAQAGDANAEYQLGKLFLYGKVVAQDQARAIAYLTSAAEHGNAYAAQLLQRFYEKNNWAVTASVMSLLQQAARIFEGKLQEYYTPQMGRTDRKLLSKIAEKKLAQGQKLGG